MTKLLGVLALVLVTACTHLPPTERAGRLALDDATKPVAVYPVNLQPWRLWRVAYQGRNYCVAAKPGQNQPWPQFADQSLLKVYVRGQSGVSPFSLHGGSGLAVIASPGLLPEVILYGQYPKRLKSQLYVAGEPLMAWRRPADLQTIQRLTYRVWSQSDDGVVTEDQGQLTLMAWQKLLEQLPACAHWEGSYERT